MASSSERSCSSWRIRFAWSLTCFRNFLHSSSSCLRRSFFISIAIRIRAAPEFIGKAIEPWGVRRPRRDGRRGRPEDRPPGQGESQGLQPCGLQADLLVVRQRVLPSLLITLALQAFGGLARRQGQQTEDYGVESDHEAPPCERPTPCRHGLEARWQSEHAASAYRSP